MKWLLLLLLFSRTLWAQDPKDVKPNTTQATTAAPAQTSPGSGAQPEAKRPIIDASNSVRINFAYAAWSLSKDKVASGSIIMREGTSGRLVQIHLIETAAGSATFSGLYSISFQNVEKFKVEFYIPPQSLLNSNDGMKKIAALIASGQLRRNPFILRRTSSGGQTIEIFDTREQAHTALKAFEIEQQVQGMKNAKFPSDQQVELAQMSEEMRKRELNARLMTERVRMEQIEAQKLAALAAQEAALTSAERAKKKKEAEQLAAEAMALYKEGRFKEAAAKFEKAVNLDADNHEYYFQYGVALYKIENAERSLIYLDLADGPLVNPVEKNFFIGLDFFKLKDYPSAVKAFDRVVAAKNPDLSPAAEFYRGIAYFEQKEWDKARGAFQNVLDTSKDPQLDNKAEAYLEQILRIQQFETERSHKWQLSATIGEQFDSNVTLSSDSSLQQGAASNVDGYRSLFQGSGRYRPIYDEKHEFAIQADLLLMYTVSDSFQYNQTLRNADPIVVTLSAPWSYKSILFGKGYKFDVSPGYESTTMSVEDNTNKMMTDSVLLNFSNLFVMSEKLYSNFNLETRHDQNRLASLSGDNDSTAVKVKLINSNLHFFWAEKTKIVTSEADITFNQAQGKNLYYNRFDLALGYIQPFKWNSSVNVKLAYYYAIYPLMAAPRIDNSYTLTTGLSKKLNDTYSTGLTLAYDINNSNTDAYQYNKWTALLTLSALTAF